MTKRLRLPKYTKTLVPVFAAFGVMTTLVVYSPTLYRLFCAATGLAGTTRRVATAPALSASDLKGAAGAQEFTVSFDGNVGPGLDWDFRPGQQSVTVKLGQPTQAYFIAHNRSNKTVVARAVFNVTPYQVAPYFYKIQCFCFTKERLGPGETAKMPLEFFIDKAFAKDPEMKLYHDVTLSYTFYLQKDLTPEAIAKARDLAEGSQTETKTISEKQVLNFDNDAPRR